MTNGHPITRAARDEGPAPRDFRVALVFMPFAIPDRPSIQLGLLSQIVRASGIHVDCHHLNLELAARLPEAYNGLCTFRGHMTGEWLFSVAAFGSSANLDDDAYFAAFPDELAQASKGGLGPPDLSRLRHTVLPKFLDNCLDLVDWSAYDVVGLSSTFQQNVASIALARRLKAKFPQVHIILGGANMEGDMGPEYARAFPWLDFVVSGEADRTLPSLIEALRRGDTSPSIPGVTSRLGDELKVSGHAAPVHDLDALPTPEYDEYFERYDRLGLKQQQRYFFALPFESSRGCWWGEKHHCTFCGLNGETMGFRRKSPDRVLEELSQLSLRYGVTMFQSTDNIMEMGYLKTLFPAIETHRHDYHFFYEVKANLTKDHLRQLRAGGVRWIQPGIESMSSHVLKLMRKGCSMLQNVRLLKWSLYYRIRVGWNLIWGFPGETEEDYRRQHEVLKLLVHLEPPNAASRIWMERFSPIYFDREAFPAAKMVPERSYAYVYPPSVDLQKIAYFFDCELDDTVADVAHTQTRNLVADWQDRWHGESRPQLVYRRTGDALFVDDTRSTELAGTHRFTGPVAMAYDHCGETMRTVQQVSEHIANAGCRFDQAEVRSILDAFCDRGLMVEEDGCYLSLALPVNPNW